MVCEYIHNPTPYERVFFIKINAQKHSFINKQTKGHIIMSFNNLTSTISIYLPQDELGRRHSVKFNVGTPIKLGQELLIPAEYSTTKTQLLLDAAETAREQVFHQQVTDLRQDAVLDKTATIFLDSVPGDPRRHSLVINYSSTPVKNGNDVYYLSEYESTGNPLLVNGRILLKQVQLATSVAELANTSPIADEVQEPVTPTVEAPTV